MAVELQKGGYTLKQHNSKKIVTQLKLTDSALRAVELFQSSCEINHKLKPSIKFVGNQGIIQIPSREQNGFQSFTFQLSTLPRSSAIDCLQQSASRTSIGSVSVMGEILQKITVHANDDTYNATKRRMEKVKEHEKSTSTKVIKQLSTSKITGRRKVFGRQLRDSSSSSPPVRMSHSFSRPVSPLSGSAVDSLVVRNKTKPILSSLSSASSSPSRIAAGRPLQEKILHYLAIRPIKFSDLITRLNRGINFVDKDRVKSVLKQIATVNDPGEHCLNRNYFTSVSSAWPGYYEDEKVIVKRTLESFRIEKTKKRPLPSPINSPSPSLLPSQEETFDPLKKKARVSLYKKSSPPISRPHSISPLQTDQPLPVGTPPTGSLLSSSTVVDLNNLAPSSDFAERQPDKKSSSPSHNPPAPRSNRRGFEPGSNRDDSGRRVQNLLAPKERPFKSAKHSSMKSGGSSESHPSSMYEATIIPSPEDSSSPSSSEYEEFIRKYQPITFDQERDRYIEDFYAEYKEYLDLYHELSALSQRFARYELELEQEEQYTDRYKMIARKVFHEYCQLMEGGVYIKQRRRFAYLVPKLKHIRNLVSEYNKKQYGVQSNSNSSSYMSR